MATCSRVMRIAEGALRVIRAVVSAMVIVFFSYMFLAVLVQVLGRYFAFSIDWAAETATLAQVWMVLLAAGLAMRENLHVRVDAFLNTLPPTLIGALTLIVTLACLWFLSLTLLGSLAMIEVGRIESSAVMRLPMWIAYLCLPLGLSYFALELVLTLGSGWQRQRSDSIVARVAESPGAGDDA